MTLISSRPDVKHRAARNRAVFARGRCGPRPWPVGSPPVAGWVSARGRLSRPALGRDTDRVPAPRIPCVGAIIKDEAGRLLLIQRGHEPETGRWSLPGGRIEPGESDEQAVVRETREETGLRVMCGALVGSVQRPGLRGGVLDIRDYAATVTGGTLAAGDDAADARWVSQADLAGLALTSGLAEALTAWGVLG
jgi:8-oxo-dGTP diphosphatase